MHHPHDHTRPYRVGSLFSGYGGLDAAVEHVFGGETIWFSEVNEPVARVFSHHWPDAPNLGDITAINWADVPPVDILTGGFPCQDVSTVGKRAGRAPGTRSGLWAHMADAIDRLRPELVVIENVRGLLSAQAIRPDPEGHDHARRNPRDATPSDATLRDLEPGGWGVGDEPARPLRALGAVLGDLADLRYDARWVGLPDSAIGAPHPRYRIFILAHAAPADTAGDRRRPRLGIARSSEGPQGNGLALPSGHRPRAQRTAWLAQMERRVGHAVAPDRGHLQRWGAYAYAIARWEHITNRAAPFPALLNDGERPRAAPDFVEWLMGLPEGWITDSSQNLSANQQATALGNGVLPLQAATALRSLANP